MTEPGDGGRQGKIVTFYSYKGGTGRSMALANVGWLLASSGKRVLMVDWDLESPGLHRFFHPLLLDVRLRSSRGLLDLLWEFALAAVSPPAPDEVGVEWQAPYTDILQFTVSIDWQFPNNGQLHLLPSGQQDDQYAAKVASFDWQNFYERLGGGAFLERVKDVMRDEYDYVLVDSRTGLSDTSGICTVHIPDVLVCCFTLSYQSIEGAAAVADSVLSQREPEFRLLPVPMRADDGEKLKLDAGRAYARREFSHMLRGLTREALDRYWGEVEVPYQSFYAFEEVLATVGDRPHTPGTLLASFERLTAHLTGGAVSTAVPLPEVDRTRLLARFERGVVTGEQYDFFVSFCAADRTWATWIAWVLAETGYAVLLDQPESTSGHDTAHRQAVERAGGVIAVLSDAYPSSSHADDVLAALGAGGRVIPVVVTDVEVPGPLAEITPVDLRGLDEGACRQLLLSASTAGGLRPPVGTGRLSPLLEGPPPTFPGPEASRRPNEAEDRDGPGPCPVCGRRLANARGHCPWCGWEAIPDGVVAGADPFEDRLHEARRHHDARAVLRVASLRGSLDALLAARLERLVRHGPIGNEERLRLLNQVEWERAQRRPTAILDQVVRDSLARLVRGDVCGIAVYEVNEAGVRWFTIEADEIGTPRLDAPDDAGFGWDALILGLSDDPNERLFQLAGGHGSRPLDLDAVDRALWPALQQTASLRDCWTKIVVESAPGWTVLDRAAALLLERGQALRTRQPEEGADALELVASLIDQAPLRHPYELVLAAVDEGSGSVSLETRTLFPAGATSSARPWTGALQALPSSLERLSLPVVVTRGRPPAEWRQVAVHSIDLPPDSAVKVTIGLDGPGRVRISSLRDVRPDGRTWQEMSALVPQRVDPHAAEPVDLVCMVELAGDRDVVQRRIDRVHDVVDRFASVLHRRLWVGALGYHDHAFSHDQVEPDPLVHVQPLDVPGEALAGLAGWRPGSERHHDFGAALEDALANLENVRWRPGSRRMLVVMAARPPHPIRQEADRGLPCPYQHDWRWLLEATASGGSLTCLAVLGPPPWTPSFPPDPGLGRRAEEAWSTLGAAGRLALDDLDLSARLLDAADVAPEEGTGPVPLAIEGPAISL